MTREQANGLAHTDRCWYDRYALSVLVLTRPWILPVVIIGCSSTFKLLLAVGIRTLVLILAESLITKVLAQFGLVLRLDLVLRMPELTCIALAALVLEEVPADTLSLQPEELLHLGLVTDIYQVDGLSCEGTGKDVVEG